MQEIITHSSYKHFELRERGSGKKHKAQQQKHETHIHNTEVFDPARDTTHGRSRGNDRDDHNDGNLDIGHIGHPSDLG